jgi:3-dehydro-L-gulonate 2-dehydrogenase
LTIGYWKGSGLALALDLLAVLLSRGLGTFQLDARAETGVSQVFIAFDVQRGGSAAPPFDVNALVESLIADFQSSSTDAGSAVLYPGERAARARADANAHGVPVDPTIWAAVCSLVQ